MTGLDVRAERGSAPDDAAAPALLITAVGRRTERIALTRLLVELEARGCDGPTRLVPLFLEREKLIA